jgi:hypothetical protein
LFQPDAEIGAVFGGAVAQEQFKGFLRENAVVLGKEAEEDADEETLEFVAGVAARLQGVVQVAHELGSFQVRRVFGIEPVMGVAGDEGEVADVLVQIGQRELDTGRKALQQWGVGVLLRFKVVEGDAGKI